MAESREAPSPELSRKLAGAARFASLSLAAFLTTMGVCITLVPRPALGHLGLSYYGADRVTVLPYSAGLLTTGYLLVKAAHELPASPRTLRVLAEALLALGLLVVGVCLTPYTVDALFHYAHFAASGLLFLVELAVAAWIAAAVCRPRGPDWALLGLQLAGAAVAMASEADVIVDRLFLGELAAQIGFGVLVVRSLRRLSRGGAAARSTNSR